MSNLLARARVLMTNKPLLTSALVLLPLASAAQKAHALQIASPFVFTSGGAAFEQTSGGSAADTTAILSALNGTPLRLNTSKNITVDSATYTNDGAISYNLTWTGFLSPSFFPAGADVTQAYFFAIDVSDPNGGIVNWTLTTNIDSEPSLSTSGVTTGVDNNFQGSASEILPQAATSTNWSTTLSLVWTDFSAASTMNISVPNATSIDLSVAATPEPASLTLLALGTATLLTRRRRHA